MSGPSAIAKPRSPKIAAISSITWLIGWMRPRSAGDCLTGSVTSTFSAASRAVIAASRSSALRAPSASVTRFFSPLMAGPFTCRSSGVIEPSVFRSSDTEPFLPSAETRTASIACSSGAAAMSAIREFSSVSISLIVRTRSGKLAQRKTRASPASAGFPISNVERLGSAGLGYSALKSVRGGVLQIFERHLGLGHERCESLRLMDRQVRQHLAVDLDAGLVQAVDEAAVGQAVLAGGGVDALHPQRPEVALARLAVAIGILQRLL